MHTSFVTNDTPQSTSNTRQGRSDSSLWPDTGLSTSPSATSVSSVAEDVKHSSSTASSSHSTASSPERALLTPPHSAMTEPTSRKAAGSQEPNVVGRHKLVASDLLPLDPSPVGLPDLNPPAKKMSLFGRSRSVGGSLFSKKESTRPVPDPSPVPPPAQLKSQDASVARTNNNVEASKLRVQQAATSKPAPRPWDEVTAAAATPFSPFVVVPPEAPSAYSSPAPTSTQPSSRVASSDSTPLPVTAPSSGASFPSRPPQSTAPGATSYSYTFDPERFPLPPYPCLRAALLPIAVLATHVQKRSQVAMDTKGASPEQALSNLFGKARGEATASWKGRILVLTSFTATTTTVEVDGTAAAPEKATYGCLHLFKNEGSGGLEIGRMPLTTGLVVSLLDPGTPEGLRVGGGRKSTLSISAADSAQGSDGKRNALEGGVRGKDEKELGADRRWVVAMTDDVTMRAWVTEIKSLLLIQRAESMGLGDVARAQKSAGISWDGDLDIALSKLTSSQVPPSASSTTLSFNIPPLPSETSNPAPISQQTSRPKPPSLAESTSDPASNTSSRSASPAPQAALTKLSSPTPGSSSQPVRPPRKSSVGSAFRNRFTRDPALSTITSPILTSSSNPLVSHLTRNDPLAGAHRDGGGDPETSFERLEAFLKTEHGMSASSRARMEDGTYSGPATPSPPPEAAAEPAKVEDIPVKQRDFAPLGSSIRSEDENSEASTSQFGTYRRGSDDPHPFSAQHPDAIPEDPQDEHRPINFRSARSGGSSSKRDSSSSDASQGRPLATSGSDEAAPSSSNSYFNSSGYLNDFLLERKPSVGSTASSQRTSSTGRSRLSHLPPPRPPPTTALPPAPFPQEEAKLSPPTDPTDSTDSPEFQKLRAENARLRAELALVSENARLQAELDAIRRASSQLTPPTSSSSGQTSPTSPTFSSHEKARRSTFRSAPPGPPPSGLPPPPPPQKTTTLAPPPMSARKGRRGSEPILQTGGAAASKERETRRPSLGLETLPELTISPPTKSGTDSLAGYRPVSYRPGGTPSMRPSREAGEDGSPAVNQKSAS